MYHFGLLVVGLIFGTWKYNKGNKREARTRNITTYVTCSKGNDKWKRKVKTMEHKREKTEFCDQKVSKCQSPSCTIIPIFPVNCQTRNFPRLQFSGYNQQIEMILCLYFWSCSANILDWVYIWIFVAGKLSKWSSGLPIVPPPPIVPAEATSIVLDLTCTYWCQDLSIL